jgi:hypothetical protein
MKKTLLYITTLAFLHTATGHAIQDLQIKLLNEEEPPLLGYNLDIQINPSNEEEPPLL